MVGHKKSIFINAVVFEISFIILAKALVGYTTMILLNIVNYTIYISRKLGAHID